MGRPKKALPTVWEPSPVLVACLVGVLTFLVFVPTLSSSFVYDAESQILIDGYIHDRSHFGEVLTFSVLGRDVLDNNRPIQLLSLMLDSLFWGKNPRGYHLTSNLIHSVNVGLLFFLAWTLLSGMGSSRRVIAAAIASLLFALHPVNVEAVAEVCFREDILATLFLLAGLLLATRYAVSVGSRAVWLGAGCVLALFLACGAKETGIAGPFLLAAYWLLFQRTQPWKRWAFLITVACVVVGVFFVARFALQPKESQILLHPPGYLGGSLWTVVQVQPMIWVFLLKCVVWPAGLSVDYVAANVLWIGMVPALIVLVVFFALAVFLAIKHPVNALGVAVIFLALAPVSNFIPIFRPLADRYLYLPMIGVALILAGVLAMAARRTSAFTALAGFSCILLFPLLALGVQRQAVFANSLALWTDTTVKSPASDTAANNLGWALLDLGDYEKSLLSFQRTIQMSNKADAWAGAAIALEKLGRRSHAEAALAKAIALENIYATPPKLVDALMCSRKNAAVLQEIRDRLPPPAN